MVKPGDQSRGTGHEVCVAFTTAGTLLQSNFLAHFELANRLVRHTQRQRRKRQQQGKQQQGRPLRVLWLTSMTHWGGDLSPAELADVPRCKKRYIPFQVKLAWRGWHNTAAMA